VQKKGGLSGGGGKQGVGGKSYIIMAMNSWNLRGWERVRKNHEKSLRETMGFKRKKKGCQGSGIKSPRNSSANGIVCPEEAERGKLKSWGAPALLTSNT